MWVVVGVVVALLTVMAWGRWEAEAQDPQRVTMFQLMQRQTDLMERIARAEERQASALEDIERELGHRR